MSNRIEQLQATHPDQALALAVLEQALRDAWQAGRTLTMEQAIAEAEAFAGGAGSGRLERST